ncbi:MAG: helix-hairpin-helix domain-containing protein [Myxococcales bacterium]|nr:helix-hairpin-helix domain-containing protein [Myxococcales bacterium]
MTCFSSALIAFAAITFSTIPALHAQVATGLVDPNVATEQELAALPHMTPAVVKNLLAARPLAGPLALDQFLAGQSLTPEQRGAFYRRAFVHLNLNTATGPEILLVPGAGKRMAHEFEEYRPWKTFAQFDKEIGKYVNKQEVARLKQYTFLPLNLNTATEAQLMTIPGVSKQTAQKLAEHRPWKSQAQFQQAFGKDVEQKEVTRLWRYVVIP